MSDTTIRLCCCDPGLANFGFSVIDYDITTGHKTVIKFDTITGKSLLKPQKEMQTRFEKRYIILWELEKRLIDVFAEINPDYVVSEAAFMHSFPASYAALVLVIQTIRTAAMKTIGRDIYQIAPKESKKAVSTDGTADKISVQDAILKNPTITIKGLNKTSPHETMTEHAWDSIAAGVAFVQNHLPSILASQKLSV